MAVKKKFGHVREIAKDGDQLVATCGVSACEYKFTGPEGRAGVFMMNNDWNAHVVSVMYPDGL